MSEDQKNELNGFIEETPIIQELKNNDALIMNKLGDLEQGQEDIEERLDQGAEQFKALWGEVTEVKKDIKDLKDEVLGGIDSLKKEIFDSKLDAAIEQNTKLAKENEQLKNKSWDIQKIIITAVIGLIALGVGIALGWK